MRSETAQSDQLSTPPPSPPRSAAIPTGIFCSHCPPGLACTALADSTGVCTDAGKPPANAPACSALDGCDDPLNVCVGTGPGVSGQCVTPCTPPPPAQTTGTCGGDLVCQTISSSSAICTDGGEVPTDGADCSSGVNICTPGQHCASPSGDTTHHYCVNTCLSPPCTGGTSCQDSGNAGCMSTSASDPMAPFPRMQRIAARRAVRSTIPVSPSARAPAKNTRVSNSVSRVNNGPRKQTPTRCCPTRLAGRGAARLRRE